MSSIMPSNREMRQIAGVALLASPILIPAAIVAAPFYGAYRGIKALREASAERVTVRPHNVGALSGSQQKLVWVELARVASVTAPTPDDLLEHAGLLLLLGYPVAAMARLRRSFRERPGALDGRTALFAAVVFARAGDFLSAWKCIGDGIPSFPECDAGVLERLSLRLRLKLGWEAPANDHTSRKDRLRELIRICTDAGLSIHWLSTVSEEHAQRHAAMLERAAFVAFDRLRDHALEIEACYWMGAGGGPATVDDVHRSAARLEAFKRVGRIAAGMPSLDPPAALMRLVNTAKHVVDRNVGAVPADAFAPQPLPVVLETSVDAHVFEHHLLGGDTCASCHVSRAHGALVPCQIGARLTPEQHRVWVTWSHCGARKGLLLVWKRLVPRLDVHIVRIIHTLALRDADFICAFSK